MAKFHKHNSSDIVTVIISILASVSLSVLFLLYSVVLADETDNHGQFSSQLIEPSAQKKYLDMRAEMGLVARIRKDYLMSGESRSIPAELTSFRDFDEHSRRCIACHQIRGKMAVQEIIEPYYPKKDSAMASIYATHAIGTDYVAASIRNSGLRDVEQLPPTMTLVNGRIACITCHDPLNPKKKGLAAEMAGNAFCFACHKYDS